MWVMKVWRPRAGRCGGRQGRGAAAAGSSENGIALVAGLAQGVLRGTHTEGYGICIISDGAGSRSGGLGFQAGLPTAVPRGAAASARWPAPRRLHSPMIQPRKNSTGRAIFLLWIGVESLGLYFIFVPQQFFFLTWVRKETTIKSESTK